MANGFGQVFTPVSGGGATASADGAPKYITGGGTIDWATVLAAVGDVTLEDGQVVPSGVKYIPYGCIMPAKTQAEVATVTVTGTPTGGTYTLTYSGIGTTVAIAYNAAASVVQTALETLFGSGNVTVAGSAGGPYTVTFSGTAGNVPTPTVGTNSLTGGTSPNVSFGTTTSGITTFGYLGPHQSNATDGRQTLTKGKCWIANQTILETDKGSQYGPGFFEGGRIYQSRLKRLNDAGTAYIAHTVDSTFNTAFPLITFAEH